MPDINTLEKVVAKLNKDTNPGEMVVHEGSKHRRFTYYLNGTLMFAFGITRSSKIKSMKLSYIPRQMRLTRDEYAELHGCTFSKADLNATLLSQEED